MYCTGRHIGLSTREPASRALIGDVHLTITHQHQPSKPRLAFSFTSDISFTVLTGKDWPHDKVGVSGKLQVTSPHFRIIAGKRLYLKEENPLVVKKLSGSKWRKALLGHDRKQLPSTLPVANLVSGDSDDEIAVSMALDHPLSADVSAAQLVVNEVRMQIPPEMFDLSKIVCGTYIDSRIMLLRSVNGSTLLFTRAPL